VQDGHRTRRLLRAGDAVARSDRVADREAGSSLVVADVAHEAKPGTLAPVERRGLLTPVLLGLVLLSFNLRPAAVSVGPVLDEVRAGLGMSATAAGLLTSLPVLAFAVFGALAPAAGRRVGPHRVTFVALLAAAAGLVGRALVDHQAPFLALSLLALGGMAMANVLLPSLVKRHYPDRIGTMTSVYTTALAIGLTTAFVLTVPIAEAFGSWRAGLAAWAVLAVVAAVPWLGLLRHDAPDASAEPARPVGVGEVARTRLGLAMAGFFGLQSMQAYAIFGWFASLWRDAGFGPALAGALVGVVAGISIPLSAWVPRLVARPGNQFPVLLTVMLLYPVAYVGLVVAPQSLAVVWALVLGAATTTFPMVLTLIGLRAATPEGTAALSSFTQSAGYLLAALGPFGVGVLHDASGGWTVPLLALAALTAPMVLLGAYVARVQHVEDQLAR
jgi:CP family cyanate transporter-like MFS transporter